MKDTYPPPPRHWLPEYHFYGPEVWHNPFDPNGCIFWRGKYHVFYLFQNKVAQPRSCGWGHASSANLLEWDFHPPVLLPDADGPEQAVYSGCALLDKTGRPVIVYCSLGNGIALAYPEDDELLVWRKFSGNPVIPEVENLPENDVYHVFDPHVWLEDGTYYAILGARRRPFMEYDCAYLFQSDDLINWQYLRPFFQSSPRFTEVYEDLACPDFFKLGPKWILLGISHALGARYYVGDYLHHTFIPREHYRLCRPGGSLFAPESCLDDRGRRIVWFWVLPQCTGDFAMDKRPETEYFRQLWSLPRHFYWDDKDNRVHFKVPGEFQQLRNHPMTLAPFTMSPGELHTLPLTGQSLELSLKMRPGREIFSLRLLEDPRSGEYAELIYDGAAGILSLDIGRFGTPSSGGSPLMHIWPDVPPGRKYLRQECCIAPDQEGNIGLQIYIDHCIIEVFIQDGSEALSQMVYPSGTANAMIRMEAKNGPVEMLETRGWQMAAIKLKF